VYSKIKTNTIRGIMMPDNDLVIVNYGIEINKKLSAEFQKEDDAILAKAKNIIEKHNFGRGSIIISEVLHTDYTDKNMYNYQSTNMNSSVKTFYEPFFTPFLTYHDERSTPIGTNVFSVYIKRLTELYDGVASGYVKLATFIPVTSKVGDEYTTDLIQQRRFISTSVGARVAMDNYKCSICGKSLMSIECTHELGKIYNDKLCYAAIHKPVFKENSIVLGNPANINAMIRRMYNLTIESAETDDPKAIKNIIHHQLTPLSMNIYENATERIFPSAEIPLESTTQETDMKDSIYVYKASDNENNELDKEISSQTKEHIQMLKKEISSALAESVIKDILELMHKEIKSALTNVVNNEQNIETEPQEQTNQIETKSANEESTDDVDIKQETNTEENNNSVEIESNSDSENINNNIESQEDIKIESEEIINENSDIKPEEPTEREVSSCENSNETTTDITIESNHDLKDVITLLRQKKIQQENGISFKSKSYRMSELFSQK